MVTHLVIAASVQVIVGADGCTLHSLTAVSILDLHHQLHGGGIPHLDVPIIAHAV